MLRRISSPPFARSPAIARPPALSPTMDGPMRVRSPAFPADSCRSRGCTLADRNVCATFSRRMTDQASCPHLAIRLLRPPFFVASCLRVRSPSRLRVTALLPGQWPAHGRPSMRARCPRSQRGSTCTGAGASDFPGERGAPHPLFFKLWIRHMYRTATVTDSRGRPRRSDRSRRSGNGAATTSRNGQSTCADQAARRDGPVRRWRRANR